MKSVVRWTGGWEMEGETESGKIAPIYTDSAPSPMEMVLQAQGACSLIDVCAGLKDRLDDVKAMWVELEANRRTEHPKSFSSIQMKYIVEGNVPKKLVHRLIKGSQEKYCSVGAMVVGSGADVEWSLELRN